MKDLFEHPEFWPDELANLLQGADEMDYSQLESLKKEVEKIGYTFDYGLDGPYGLRKVETREERARRLILENSTYGLSEIKLAQKMYLGYIEGLSPKAVAFVRANGFARVDESGDPENDIYCMEGLADDILTGHTIVPIGLKNEIDNLIQFCKAEKLIWIGIS